MGAAASLRARADRPVVKPVEALVHRLDDLAALLLEIPLDVYVARPVPEVSGSIGAQVRHTLDHVAALVAAAPGAPLAYDRRERGTAVEHDPSCALRAIFRLKAALASFTADSLGDPCEVVVQVSASGETVRAWSSRARELAFVQSHTIHHQAIIAMLLVVQGHESPTGFGYAPSTPSA